MKKSLAKIWKYKGTRFELSAHVINRYNDGTLHRQTLVDFFKDGEDSLMAVEILEYLAAFRRLVNGGKEILEGKENLACYRCKALNGEVMFDEYAEGLSNRYFVVVSCGDCDEPEWDDLDRFGDQS